MSDVTKIQESSYLPAARSTRHSIPRRSSSDRRVISRRRYVMSEKATGYDWMKRSGYRVVHAAGHTNYSNQQDNGNSSVLQAAKISETSNNKLYIYF